GRIMYMNHIIYSNSNTYRDHNIYRVHVICRDHVIYRDQAIYRDQSRVEIPEHPIAKHSRNSCSCNNSQRAHESGRLPTKMEVFRD
ncbi:hypothetical protein Bpfe_028612, partial [Biomphalaria pfeifferi]